MGTEIERKFLVADDTWRQAVAGAGIVICQGYLSIEKERTVRIRTAGASAFLTIKGANTGMSRPEFEYAIPVTDAAWMLDALCLRPLIEKTRYIVPYRGWDFEIDEFQGGNAGLVLAEIELASEDQPVEFPRWIGKEVTDDLRYYNANMVRHPGAWRQK